MWHWHPSHSGFEQCKHAGGHEPSGRKEMWKDLSRFIICRREVYMNKRKLFAAFSLVTKNYCLCLLLNLSEVMEEISGRLIPWLMNLNTISKWQIQNPETPIYIAKNYEQFNSLIQQGKIAVAQSIEGAHALGRDLCCDSRDQYIEHLDHLIDRGVCMMTLAHFFSQWSGVSCWRYSSGNEKRSRSALDLFSEEDNKPPRQQEESCWKNAGTWNDRRPDAFYSGRTARCVWNK